MSKKETNNDAVSEKAASEHPVDKYNSLKREHKFKRTKTTVHNNKTEKYLSGPRLS